MYENKNREEDYVPGEVGAVDVAIADGGVPVEDTIGEVRHIVRLVEHAETIGVLHDFSFFLGVISTSGVARRKVAGVGAAIAAGNQEEKGI
jgi:hypothetical protein